LFDTFVALEVTVLELRHLRYFLAVASEEHLGRAASRLHVSASPLSRQIQELERELGVELFERVGRGLRLTDAGRAFQKGAQAVLGQLEAVARTTRSVALGDSGHLSVAFVETRQLAEMMPEIVVRVRARHPHLGIELSPLSSPEQHEALRAGQIDAGFSHHLPSDGALRAQALFSERMLLAVPAGHRLAKLRRVSARLLADEVFIWVPKHVRPDLHHEVESALRTQGVSFRVGLEARSTSTRLSLVASRMGLTLVTESTRLQVPKQVVLKPLSDVKIELRTWLLWRAADERSAVLRSLREIALSLTPPRTRSR
jgi:DNA-binding transcriptional LysR family regulator